VAVSYCLKERSIDLSIVLKLWTKKRWISVAKAFHTIFHMFVIRHKSALLQMKAESEPTMKDDSPVMTRMSDVFALL